MTNSRVKLSDKAELSQLSKISFNKCDIQVCLASTREAGAPDFQRLILAKGVVEEFARALNSISRKLQSAIESDEIEIREYEPASKLDSHEYEYLDLNEHSTISEQIKGLADPVTIDSFEQDEEFIDGLRFYVIIVRCKKHDPMYFFRVYTKKKELTRSGRFGLVLAKDQFDKLRTPLYLFDDRVDCFALGGNMFIRSKGNFQQIFQFYELIVASAEKVLQKIKKHIPIDDFDAFAEACKGHLQKLAKLKNIAEKPYMATLKMRDIKKAVRRYSLPITTVGTGSSEKLHFDSSDKWAILKLLDDDYLESVMTGNQYEVNSKRGI